MPTVAEVMRRHGAAYLERFGAAMPAEHKKVLRTIMACRTGQLGTVLYRCTSCGRRTSWVAPVANGIVRLASRTRPGFGSRPRPTVCYRAHTS